MNPRTLEYIMATLNELFARRQVIIDETPARRYEKADGTFGLRIHPDAEQAHELSNLRSLISKLMPLAEFHAREKRMADPAKVDLVNFDPTWGGSQVVTVRRDATGAVTQVGQMAADSWDACSDSEGMTRDYSGTIEYRVAQGAHRDLQAWMKTEPAVLTIDWAAKRAAADEEQRALFGTT